MPRLISFRGRAIIVCLLVAMLAVPTCLSGCGPLFFAGVEDTATRRSRRPPAFDPSLPEGEKSLEVSRAAWDAWAGDEHGYWHSCLDGRAREMYDEIYPQLVRRETDIHVSSVDSFQDDQSSMDLGMAIYAITKDHPELFWIDLNGLVGAQYQYWNELGRGIELQGVTYRYGEDEIADLQAKLDASVAEALATVPEGATDYEQALALYKWVGDNVAYDEGVSAALHAGNEEGADALTAKLQTADTALVGRNSVCAGYSAAYKLLLSRLGIPCAIIDGDIEMGNRSEDHSWNLVCLGGRMGYVDVTWSDMTESYEAFDKDGNKVTLTDDGGAVRYMFFFMTDADMEYDARVALSPAQEVMPAFGSGVVDPLPEYVSRLPKCDSLIWVDDRYEPSSLSVKERDDIYGIGLGNLYRYVKP